MRRMKSRMSPHPKPERGRVKFAPPLSRHAEELMELAVEAAQSRDLPDFLEQFALRSTRMLDAIWGGWPFTVDAKRNFTPCREAAAVRRKPAQTGSFRARGQARTMSRLERSPKRLPRACPFLNSREPLCLYGSRRVTMRGWEHSA